MSATCGYGARLTRCAHRWYAIGQQFSYASNNWQRLPKPTTPESAGSRHAQDVPLHHAAWGLSSGSVACQIRRLSSVGGSPHPPSDDHRQYSPDTREPKDRQRQLSNQGTHSLPRTFPSEKKCLSPEAAGAVSTTPPEAVRRRRRQQMHGRQQPEGDDVSPALSQSCGSRLPGDEAAWTGLTPVSHAGSVTPPTPNAMRRGEDWHLDQEEQADTVMERDAKLPQRLAMEECYLRARSTVNGFPWTEQSAAAVRATGSRPGAVGDQEQGADSPAAQRPPSASTLDRVAQWVDSSSSWWGSPRGQGEEGQQRPAAAQFVSPDAPAPSEPVAAALVALASRGGGVLSARTTPRESEVASTCFR